MSTTYTAVRRPARENYWQDWANAIVAVWFFISPWVMQFGAGAPAAEGRGDRRCCSGPCRPRHGTPGC